MCLSQLEIEFESKPIWSLWKAAAAAAEVVVAAVAACFTKFSRRIWLDDAIVFWRFVTRDLLFVFSHANVILNEKTAAAVTEELSVDVCAFVWKREKAFRTYMHTLIRIYCATCDCCTVNPLQCKSLYVVVHGCCYWCRDVASVATVICYRIASTRSYAPLARSFDCLLACLKGKGIAQEAALFCTCCSASITQSFAHPTAAATTTTTTSTTHATICLCILAHTVDVCFACFVRSLRFEYIQFVGMFKKVKSAHSNSVYERLRVRKVALIRIPASQQQLQIKKNYLHTTQSTRKKVKIIIIITVIIIIATTTVRTK